MSKHTKGPWRIEVEGEGEQYVIHGNCHEPEGHDVSNVVAYIAGRTDHSIADAHLICSAPDLLAALKDVTSIARAAIGRKRRSRKRREGYDHNQKCREVIRSYDRALAILRDECGVMHSRRTGYRISWNGKESGLATIIADKLHTDRRIKRATAQPVSGADYVYATPEEKDAEIQAAKSAIHKRRSAQDAGRQRREDARVRQILDVTDSYHLYPMAKDKLLAILRDVEANGI